MTNQTPVKSAAARLNKKVISLLEKIIEAKERNIVLVEIDSIYHEAKKLLLKFKS